MSTGFWHLLIPHWSASFKEQWKTMSCELLASEITQKIRQVQLGQTASHFPYYCTGLFLGCWVLCHKNIKTLGTYNSTPFFWLMLPGTERQSCTQRIRLCEPLWDVWGWEKLPSAQLCKTHFSSGRQEGGSAESRLLIAPTFIFPIPYRQANGAGSPQRGKQSLFILKAQYCSIWKSVA